MLAASWALTLLAGCGPRAPSAAELAQRQQARVAQELGAQYDAARAREDFALAQILGKLVLAQHPASPEAQRMRPDFADVEQRAEAQRERKRQADLWTYHAVPMANAKGTVYTGFLWAQVEPGSPLPAVRLVLRNHPEWGLSAYLLVDSAPRAATASTAPSEPAPDAPVRQAGGAATAGPYRCPDPACHIDLRFDDGAAQTFTAYEPDERHTGALFIAEYDALTAGITGAQWMRIDLPTPAGIRELRYEVAGFDPNRLVAPRAARQRSRKPAALDAYTAPCHHRSLAPLLLLPCADEGDVRPLRVVSR